MRKQKLEITILEANEDLSKLREGDLVYANVDEKDSVVRFMFHDIAIYGGILRMQEEREDRHLFIFTSKPLNVDSKITFLAAEYSGHVGEGCITGLNAINLKDLPEYNEDRIRLINLAKEALTK